MSDPGDLADLGGNGPSVDQLHLSLAAEGSGLSVTVHNPTDRPVRIWDRACSWGWGMLTLEVHQGGAVVLLAPVEAVFTRNFPRWLVLDPGEDVVVSLGPGDPAWQLDGSTLADDAGFEVRAILSIEQSDEAVEHGVALGRSISEPLLLEPPNTWLFG